MKDQLRRGNLVRGSSKKATQKAFTAMFILDAPGLATIGRAFRDYFDFWAKESGCDPRKYFKSVSFVGCS